MTLDSQITFKLILNAIRMVLAKKVSADHCAIGVPKQIEAVDDDARK